MKTWVKYAIAVSSAAVILTGSLFLSDITREKYAPITCSGIDVQFTDTLKFVTENDIKKYITSNYGPLTGERTDSIKLWKIEELLRSRSAIGECEVWTTPDGILHIQLSQRAPAVRYRFNDGSGFYVDDRGFIFPLHPSYTAPVPVLSGYIPVDVPTGYKGEAATEKEHKWLAGTIALTAFFEDRHSWAGKVLEYTVNRNGDIIIKLDGHGEDFIIGAPDQIEQKAEKIKKYLDYVVPSVNGKPYRSVNLKYNNQLICRKDI